VRIAIDYRILSLLPAWRTRGIPRYTQQQVREVLRVDRENEYILLTPPTYEPGQILPEILSAPNLSRRVFAWSSRVPAEAAPDADHLTLRKTEEFQTWLVRERVDLFHSPTPWFQTETIFPAIDVCPTVTALYDLIPLLFPEEFGLPDVFWQRLYGALPWATRLLAISEHTRQDAVRLLNLDASRIDIAYPIADPAYCRLPSEEVARRLAPLRRSHGLPERFLLTVTFVGGATKNVELLLHAYAALPSTVRRVYPLVVVGYFGPPCDGLVRALMERLGVSDTVIVTGVVPDETLAALYNAATLFVTTTRYEGFGMPLLEAMQCGAPVLSSTSSSMPEVVGAAGALVPPDEAPGFTQAIADIVGSPERQADMREAGLAQARRFSAEGLARATLASYARAAGGPPPSGSPATRLEAGRPAPGRRLALWVDVPPRAGEAARRGLALVESLSPHAEIELFVDGDELPSPTLLRRYRVHHHVAFDRRHGRAPFDALIFQPDAHTLAAAVDEVARRYPALPLFGTAAGHGHVRPGVRDPRGLRPDLERELARTVLGVSTGTFVVGVAYERTADGSVPTDPVLEAIGAVTRRLLDVRVVMPRDAGEREDRLEARLGAHGLRRHVQWVTPDTVDAADDHWLACDVVVSVAGPAPSEALANALAAGRAVLAVGPVWSCVSDDACWRLPDAAASIEEALITLALDPARRTALERAARACFEKDFTLAVMAEAYCTAVDQARATPRAPAADTSIGEPETRPRPVTRALRFNKACELEDFTDSELGPLLRELRERHGASTGPAEFAWDRKEWEVAMAVRTLRALGAVRPDANILGVAAGMEDTIYHLAPLVREMTVVDRYLDPGQWDSFAPQWMLLAPELGARIRAGDPAHEAAARVRVAYMDARRLRFGDDTFDGVFSSGSIEHFGGLLDIAHAAYEIGRVLKPGGVASISTELLLRGPTEPDVMLSDNMIVLRSAQIRRYIIEASGLEPVDDLDTEISAATRASRQAVGYAYGLHHLRTIRAGVRGPAWSDRMWSRPHVVLEHQGFLFGSVHVALRKTPTFPATPNGWARPGHDVVDALTLERREVMAALGGWGAAVAPGAARRDVGQMAAAIAKAEARANEAYVTYHAARENMAALDSEIRRVDVDLPTKDSAAVQRDLARLREEVHRLAVRTAAMERRALGWRTVMRGIFLLLTPLPAPVVAHRDPGGFRGRILRLARRFRPIARRLPRLALYIRRWIYTG
jgi:glycosyltransferase involved in cell wall biosynthesis/SAM-dependent methyltransferase